MEQELGVVVELELELELGVGVRQVAVSKLFIFGQNKGFLLLLFFQPLKQLQLQTNRPFPSSLAPLFQNESKCENEFCMQFHFHTNQSHFQKNGFHLHSL